MGVYKYSTQHKFSYDFFLHKLDKLIKCVSEYTDRKTFAIKNHVYELAKIRLTKQNWKRYLLQLDIINMDVLMCLHDRYNLFVEPGHIKTSNLTTYYIRVDTPYFYKPIYKILNLKIYILDHINELDDIEPNKDFMEIHEAYELSDYRYKTSKPKFMTDYAWTLEAIRLENYVNDKSKIYVTMC